MKKNISRNPLWPDWYNGKMCIRDRINTNPGHAEFIRTAGANWYFI